MALGYNNGYMNPYSNMYQNGSYPQYPQQMAQPQNQQSTVSYAQPAVDPSTLVRWVDGEGSAKAAQLPVGWPANIPYPMWDTNDQIIYFKSYNAIGMPNPLRKARYTWVEENQQNLMSGSAAPSAMPEYVTKEDFNSLKEDLLAIARSATNQGRPQQQRSADNRNGGRANDSAV